MDTLDSALNATDRLFNVYGLLVEHCETPPNAHFEHAYGSIASLLLLALIALPLLALAQDVSFFAEWLIARVSVAVGALYKAAMPSSDKSDGTLNFSEFVSVIAQDMSAPLAQRDALRAYGGTPAVRHGALLWAPLLSRRSRVACRSAV